jgi:hypothetical protein
MTAREVRNIPGVFTQNRQAPSVRAGCGHFCGRLRLVITAKAWWRDALASGFRARGFAFVSDHLIFGLRSSCERAEFMLALVKGPPRVPR